MAMTRATLLCLTLVALLLVISQVVESLDVDKEGVENGKISGPQRRLLDYDCKGECDRRCSKAGLKKRCLNFCGICCQKCKCVPPGTYGNKEVCPCYNDMKNSKGKSKCP